MTDITILNIPMGTERVILSVLIFILTGFTAAILAAYCSEQFGGSKHKAIWFFTVFSMLMAIALVCFFGLTAAAFRGIILCLILLFASFSDCKTRECPDYVHILIVVAAFIGIDAEKLPAMLFAAFLVTAFQLAGAIITDSDINGADLKLSASCAFMLGTMRGLCGLVAGLVLAVIVNLFRRKGRGEGFPLLPYLSAGFMAAYFI